MVPVHFVRLNLFIMGLVVNVLRDIMEMVFFVIWIFLLIILLVWDWLIKLMVICKIESILFLIINQRSANTPF